jgi:hypothetical protein
MDFNQINQLVSILTIGEVIITIMKELIKAIKWLFKQRRLNEDVNNRLHKLEMQQDQIFSEQENQNSEKAAQRKWEDRDRIGFKK